MIFKKEIYYSITTKKHYISEDSGNCTTCSVPLNKLCFGFKPLEERQYNLFCFKCSENCKKIMDKFGGQMLLLIMSDIKPKDSMLIIQRKQSIKNNSNNETVFSAATKKDGAKVVDRTKLAGKETFDGLTFGDPSIMKKVERLDTPISNIVKGIGYLEELKSSTPLINEDQNTMIEDKNDTANKS